jgi:hypothetical protein
VHVRNVALLLVFLVTQEGIPSDNLWHKSSEEPWLMKVHCFPDSTAFFSLSSLKYDILANYTGWRKSLLALEGTCELEIAGKIRIVY